MIAPIPVRPDNPVEPVNGAMLAPVARRCRFPAPAHTTSDRPSPTGSPRQRPDPNEERWVRSVLDSPGGA